MALYKFQIANMNSLIALKKNSLYFSELEKFNDPTENMFGFLSSEENIDSEIIPDIKELRKYSLLCMGTDGETDKEKLESNLLMWTHYGAELSGICLVFDDEMLKKSFEYHECCIHKKVEYGHPKLLAPDQLLGEHIGIEREIPGFKLIDRNTERVINDFIFNKPNCFNYESEYRFLLKKSGLITYNRESLKKIIIGSKIESKSLRELFIETAKAVNSEIEVYNANVRENSFNIYIEKCL
ncbi:DUF2971 domain-containing protein [Psychromonas sp. PT13]|uniref:DUF2971 domain-containing protein n=1 Tax=Psychromonas sp. PT13 TaxID=3439547 RepID=UPI003EBE9705